MTEFEKYGFETETEYDEAQAVASAFFAEVIPPMWELVEQYGEEEVD